MERLFTEKNLPRGDYFELAELLKFYLTTDENYKIQIKPAGLVHHARFMSQSIYFMKMKIMSNVTNIGTTAATSKEISEMAEFIGLYYARWFLQATLTACSPRFDLEAVWEMKNYSNVRSQVAEKCLKSMKHHSWYLHGSVIPLCLVDPELKEDEKKDVAEKIYDLIHVPIINTDEEEKFRYRKKDLTEVMKKESQPSLAEFVDKNSRIIFDILDIKNNDTDWLRLPPSVWHLITPFKKFQNFIKNLPVVNDAAERNVKLIQDFVDSSTDEELRQDLLLAVGMKRKAGRSKGTTKKRKL